MTGLARFQTPLGQKPQVSTSEAKGRKRLEGVAAEEPFKPCGRPRPRPLQGLSTPFLPRLLKRWNSQAKMSSGRGLGEKAMSSLHQERWVQAPAGDATLKPLHWFLTLPRTVRSDPSGIRPGALRSARDWGWGEPSRSLEFREGSLKGYSENRFAVAV